MAIVFDKVNCGLFHDLSFGIKKAKITFIVGRGKSFLLSLIAGDSDDYEGDILRNVSLKKIGFLRQNYMDYFLFNTVYDEFRYVLKKRNLKINYDKQILKALKMVDLDASVLKRTLFELSKSEQKKLAIAMLLSQRLDVFVLDDPFSYLDFESRKRLVKLFRMMKLKYNKTIIIVGDTDMTLELADDVIGICDGKIFFEGDKFDLFTNIKLLKKYNLNVPKLIEFSFLVKKRKNINIGYRDDINDLVKDIYRFVR